MRPFGPFSFTQACTLGIGVLMLALTMVLAAYVGSLVGGMLSGIVKVGFLAGYHLFTN